LVIGVTENGKNRLLAFNLEIRNLLPVGGRPLRIELRGLNSQTITLGIMDGLPGLEKVFERNFPKERYKGARSTSHVMCWLRFRKN